MKITVLLAAIISFTTFTANSASIDLDKSSFTWRGSKVIGGSFHSGPIKMKSAKLNDGKGEFVADMNTIDDSTLDDGKLKGQFLSHVKGPDFFEVGKFPTATLKIEKMDNGYLYGKLTVKGVTQSVTVPYTKKGNVYTGDMGFDRTQYKVVYGSGNFFKNLGDKVIADTITLKFKVVTK